MILVIANIRYSSWSLRPWLLMSHFGIKFEERLIPLDQPQTKGEILKFSPAGKVPVLIDGNVKVWESLAIMEHLHERFPELGIWPRGAAERATARSVANEMHAGFLALRHQMPHNLGKDPKHVTPHIDTQADIDRIRSIWTSALEASGGPFLFGDFTAADAMFAPVVNRFVTYGVQVSALCAKYMAAVRALPAHQAWMESGRTETLRIAKYE